MVIVDRGTGGGVKISRTQRARLIGGKFGDGIRIVPMVNLKADKLPITVAPAMGRKARWRDGTHRSSQVRGKNLKFNIGNFKNNIRRQKVYFFVRPILYWKEVRRWRA